MGLDMYLYLSKYESVARWRENGEERAKSFYPAELQSLGADIFRREFMVTETKYLVGYWRKMYAIHEWILCHCSVDGDGRHDIYMTEDEATELMGLCKDIYHDHSKATELLPVANEEDLDDYFFEDILYTARLLSNVLGFLQTEEGKAYEIVYNASW